MSRARWPARGVACLLAGAAALAPAAAPAHAQRGSCTKLAAPNGSDSGAGTPGSPYRTPQRLADSLSPGQTGCLRSGSYHGDVEIRSGGTSSRPLRITSYAGEKATVVGEFEVHRTAPYVVVDHLYLNGRTADRASPLVNANGVAFRHNDVTNDHTGICFLLGDSNGAWGRADRALIAYNRIHDCGRLPATNLDHGIYVEATTGAVVKGNWIYGNADFGVHLYPDAQRTNVSGNVIDGNGMGLIFAGEGGDASSNNRVVGNVIANSRRRWNVDSWWGSGRGHGNVTRRNCVHGANRTPLYNRRGGITTDAGGFRRGSNRIAAPRYRRRAAGDLRLARSSRCRAVFAGDPDAVPGPDGSVQAAARRRTLVRLRSGTSSVRRGQRVRLRGRVAAPASGVLLYARAGKRVRLVARLEVSPSGRFVAGPRVRTRARRLRFRAVVPHVGRSPAVGVRVRG